MCRSIFSKIAHQMWHDHPFSQRSRTTKRTVGMGVGGDRGVRQLDKIWKRGGRGVGNIAGAGGVQEMGELAPLCQLCKETYEGGARGFVLWGLVVFAYLIVCFWFITNFELLKSLKINFFFSIKMLLNLLFYIDWFRSVNHMIHWFLFHKRRCLSNRQSFSWIRLVQEMWHLLVCYNSHGEW